MVFSTNDGDNINITKGDPSYDDANTPTPPEYVKNSSNFLFSSGQGITITLDGFLKLKPATDDPNTEYALRWFTDKDRDGFVVNVTDVITEVQVPTNFSITLQPNEKLFLIGFAGFGAVEIMEGNLNITFSSRYKTTETWAITAYDLFKLLVAEINKSGSTGQQILNYQAESRLLSAYKNLVLCSGDALRAGNDPSYPGPIVIKTSLSDFFDSMNAILCASLGNQQLPELGEVLFFEEREYVFYPSEVTLNIGEVSDLGIDIATDYYWNQLKIGYPNQSYDQRAGKYEYNTTAIYGAPIKSIAKEVDLVSKYRADSYGIEYTRFNSGGKSTTHNNSDNSVFILNIDPPNGEFSRYSADRGALTLTSGSSNVALPLPNTIGDYFKNNEQYTVFTFVRSLNMPQFGITWESTAALRAQV
ncbi:hypothetical protein [Paraflavitalea speifideaquila]|uniref:hypothetical protein n=1 Tax=Paraflavitalea speifideaquila TaxID=3076558 RepID=UPI0028E1F5C1|nr:hypothetical protein [Paraflavitalea speifideiaquila]